MLIYQLLKYINRLGIKTFLFPIFILLILIFAGFIPSDNFSEDISAGVIYAENPGSPVLSSLQFSKSNSDFHLITVSDSTDSTEQSTDSVNVFDPDSIHQSLSDSTIKAIQDSLRLDSLKQDSTARLEYFRYYRDDPVNVGVVPKNTSSFFAQPSSALLKRTVELDSTGQYVYIKEFLGQNKYKVGLKLPLQEYIKLRLQGMNRKDWEKIAYKYELKSDKKELSQIITDITNIDIPLPSASFLSIFGPPKINLRINGAVDIHGAWRSETKQGVTASALGNTRSEPDFKQTVQISVNGTIGDKLTIAADWNTERTFQYENQLKIKYTGYEDEIIQSIEAGNVSLQTSPLVGGSEALFGIKSHFQLGPFSLYALASQKKGETEEVSLTSGAQSQKFEIHAYDYSQNHYFLDSVYADKSPDLNLFNRKFGNPVFQSTPTTEFYRVKDIEVWKTITGLLDPNEKKGNAFIDLPDKSAGQLYDSYRDSTLESIPGKQEIGRRFIRLTQGVDYELHAQTGFISFRTQIQEQDAIGVAYRIEGPTTSQNDDRYYGEFLQELGSDSSAVIVLKLVKPPNLQPQFKKAWQLQLKNIYPIGGRDVKEEGFKFDITFRKEGSEPTADYNGTNLLEAFGLDKTDESGTSTSPDGAFDFFQGRTIIPFTGEIIFPVLEPFGQDLPSSLPDTLRYDAIYDTTVTFAKQDRTKDKFIMSGEYSASVSSTYSIGFNVVENSVRVTLNGRELTAGVDYTVDYNIGQVTIRNDEALNPGADLKITYEQNDLFQLASKTLLGLRGIYEFNKDTRLGFSYLSLNQQTLSDKVRIGEEPLDNSIFGADLQAKIDFPFITKGLDNIISTKAMSSFNMKGEFAYINPDPNTKKSIIPQDQGKSIAYIDDFEGAKKIIPVGIGYSSWKDLSVPTDLPFIGNRSVQQQMNYKAKSFWYNVVNPDVNVNDIWPNREASRENQLVTVLDYVYRPDLKGTYNWNPTIDTLTQNWGGMMKVLSSTANNLTEENVEFIEFWMHIVDAPPDAKMYIDLGEISEDVIPNNVLDTEDKNTNDLVDQGEDTGIDGLTDMEEPGYDADTNPDPSGDNYGFNRGSPDYVSINGTEGNSVSTDLSKLPDSEDLNRNFTLDKLNSYFRYEIPIDTNRNVNPFIKGGGDNAGWYLFRIPLKDFTKEIGDPSLSVVEYIRLWVSGVSEEVHVRIADMNLVGNQWQKLLKPPNVTQEDTVLTISTINIEDNPEYTAPVEGLRERDRTKPDEKVFKNEQSLNLIIKKLEDGDQREVIKYLYRPLDLFNYKEMKMFIHGDLDSAPGSVSRYVDETDFASEVFLRFGSDSLNYYEYRQPLQSDWHELNVIFSELTAIKQARESDSTIYRVPIDGQPGHSYAVRGNPTLTRVSYFDIGILNPDDVGTPGEKLSGNIWFNELRVLDADNSSGWAYSASTSLNLADLMSIDFNMSQTNPYFHKLSERFGSRVDKKSWSVAVNFDLLKLIPANLSGSNFRLNYSRSESVQKPLYLPSTDINVDEAANEMRKKLVDENVGEEEIKTQVDKLKTDVQTINVSETWSMNNIKFKIPSNDWYLRDLVNGLSFGFTYNKTVGRNPTTLKNESWVWKANANYQVNFSRDLYFKPVEIPYIGDLIAIFGDYRDVKIYFAPQSFQAGISANRKKSFVQTRTKINDPNIQRDFIATRSAGFNWIVTDGGFLNPSLSYNMDISSSLTYLLTTDNGVEKPENEIWKEIFSGTMFGRDYDFKQNIDFKLSPKIPSLWDLNKNISVDMGYNVLYNWKNNFQQEDLGRSAGFNSRFNAGINIRLKSLMAPLFEEDKSTAGSNIPQNNSRSRGRGRRTRRPPVNLDNKMNEANVDSASVDSMRAVLEEELVRDSLANLEQQQGSITSDALLALRDAVKWAFFDYDQITFNFTQETSHTGSGIAGDGNGFNNFWGVNQSDNKGPSRLYMLGFSTDVGARAPNGNLTDNFSQKHSIDFKTSRPLWEGAQIDLNWRVSWGINKTTTINTDEFGNLSITNISSTATIDRTFLSFPPSLIFSFLGNGITKVNELYNPNAENPNQNLSDAFLEGFESFPLLAKIPFLSDVTKYIPRPNWNFSWSGLEKISFLSFASKVTINHSYVSNYNEGLRVNPDGVQEVQTQRIDYGFAPLVGISMSFQKLWGGNLTANVKYSTKTIYALGVSTRNITETFSKDINVSASYSKSGFEVPLFGISLKNDMEISLSYTSAQNSSILFELDDFNESGKPLDGTTRTTIEPRIKYVMSSRVTLSLFYRRTTVEPQGAARIPPTTTNEAGLDVHISIQ